MFNQRVGRTLHRTGDPARAQQAANERRFAGPEVALQRHDHPAAQRGRNARAARFGGGRVGEMQCQR